MALIGVAFAAALAATAAVAAPCQQPAKYVQLTVVGADGMDAAKVEAIRSHLAAELIEQGVAVCLQGQPHTAALGKIEVHVQESTVKVVILNDATATTVARTTNLDSVPPKAQPLAIGIAAAELLLATWHAVVAKAESDERSPTKAEAPTVSTTIVAPPNLPTHPWAMSAGLSFDAFAGGLALWGPDIELSVEPWRAWRMGLRAMFRTSLREQSLNGDSQASAVGGAAFVARRLVASASGWHVDGLLVTSLARIAAEGRALPGATAYEGASLLGTTLAGLRVCGATMFHPVLDLTAGTCWACVSLSDGPLRFVSSHGFHVSLALRLEIGP